MKDREVQRVSIRSTQTRPSPILGGPKDGGVLMVDASRIPTSTATLFLRLHIIYLAGGRTRDKLQWSDAEAAPTWFDFPEGGKVVIAEFRKDDDTAVRVVGKAFVVQENGTSSLENVELFIQDWELDGVRKADVAGTLGMSVEIKTGKFDLDPTGGLAAYHDVNFNIIVKLGTSFFVFDPLVIIAPKRP
jgi:hypothetical protein